MIAFKIAVKKQEFSLVWNEYVFLFYWFIKWKRLDLILDDVNVKGKFMNTQFVSFLSVNDRSDFEQFAQ